MSELSDQLQLALGANYRIERELGGGMSRVFVAEDLRLARKVVLKVLPPELAHDPAVRTRFMREAQTSAQLSHSHIVSIYDACAGEECEAKERKSERDPAARKVAPVWKSVSLPSRAPLH